MFRRAFTLLASVSFLMFVGIIALWVRHYHLFVPRERSGRYEREYLKEDRPLQSLLDRQLPEVTFDGVGLSDVCDFLNDVSGAYIQVDWKSIEAAGISRNTPISFKSVNQPFSVVLTRIVNLANLAFTCNGDIIRISTRKSLLEVHDEYRQAWPWPSDDDLQAKYALSVVLSWAWDRPTPIDIEGPRRESRSPPPPKFPCIEDAFIALADAMGVPIDVDWYSLEPLGITKLTVVDPRFNGHSSDWIGEVIRQASPEGNIQYQFCDGRVTVASRQSFGDREDAYRRALWTCAGSVSVIWLLLLLLLIRWKMNRSRSAFWFATVLLIGGVTALFVWEMQSTSLQWRIADHRFVVDLNDPKTLAFSVRPLVLPDRPIGNDAPIGTPTILYSGSFLSVRRSGPQASEVFVTTPFHVAAGLSLLLPACWLIGNGRRRVIRMHRRRTGRCIGCGYDLRASAGKCPECGMSSVGNLAPSAAGILTAKFSRAIEERR